MSLANANPKHSFFKRTIRSIISIIVLSAFVLGISLSIKQVATLNSADIVALSGPLLSKLGLSEEQVGDVAGAFANRLLSTAIPASNARSVDRVPLTAKQSSAIAEGASTTRKSSVLRIAIMSDSEDDNAMLQQALNKTAELNIDVVFHLGDLTQFGTVDALNSAKALLDSSGKPYYVLPGDHDLYQSVGSENFIQVFGDPNTSVIMGDFKFVFLDNSANYTPLSVQTVDWFNSELDGADFVLISQPLYHATPSVLTPVMGVVNGERNAAVYAQRGQLLESIESSNVQAVFAGDHHRSSKSIDAVDADLVHYAIGAVNESKLIQSARFSVLTIYNTGEFDLEEVLLD